EHNPLQMTSASDLSSAHRTDKNVALPLRKTVAGINGHSSDGDGGYPHHDRRLQTFPRRVLGNARPSVVAPKADDGPAVIAAGKDDVDLIAAVRAIFVIPQSTSLWMDHKAQRIPVSKGVNLRPVTRTAHEGVVGRRRTIIAHAQNLAS